MATKYGKYVITGTKPNLPFTEAPRDRATTLIYLDDEVVKGAFNVICAWFWPETKPIVIMPESHAHDFDEVLAFFGTNPDNPKDLCGEIELWLEDEKQILTKSCLVFVPKGMMHAPITIRRIDRPVFHFSALTGGMWGKGAE